MASVKSFLFGTAEHTLKDGAKTALWSGVITGGIAALATVAAAFAIFSNPIGWALFTTALVVGATVGTSFAVTGGTVGALFGALTGGLRGVRADGDRHTGEIEKETALLHAQNARKMEMVKAAGSFDNPHARSDAQQRLAAQQAAQVGAQGPGK